MKQFVAQQLQKSLTFKYSKKGNMLDKYAANEDYKRIAFSAEDFILFMFFQMKTEKVEQQKN